MVTITTSQVDLKQEVENSEYVRPFEDHGEPVKNTTSGKASAIAKVKGGKLTFSHPGVDGRTRMTVRLPDKPKTQKTYPVDTTLSDDPVDEGNGCTSTEEKHIEGGLTITRRK
jgi:hypothetical protein